MFVKLGHFCKNYQNLANKNKIPILYLAFLAIVLSSWLLYMVQHQLFYLFEERIPIALTMLFGSFIAGSSPEGSAAIAYPVFTLYLKIEPRIATNFAFAIQSIGMTAASLLILNLKLKLDWQYIRFVTIGGLVGLVFGTYFIVPYISPPLAKLFFVSLWLSFALILWRQNKQKKRLVFDEIIGFGQKDILLLVSFGLVGGMISSIFGTGINIFTFCLMVAYYKISEKVATPSSIIIMTIETIFGLFLHTVVTKDFQQESLNMWLVCVPVVIFFAPLGSFVMSKLPRLYLANFLYGILLVQFVGAFWVLKPSINHLFLSLLTVVTGVFLFHFISKSGDKRLNQPQ